GGPPGRDRAACSPRSVGEDHRRTRETQGRDDVERPEVSGRGGEERGGVDEGWDRRLAVERVAVERSAVLDDVPCGRDGSFVGVEELVDVAGEVREERAEDDDADADPPGPPGSDGATSCEVALSGCQRARGSFVCR